MKVLAALVVVAWSAGCAGPAVEGAPAWSFVDTEGVERSREEAAGNVSVLFFMATWCGACRQNAPRLANVWADEEGSGLRFYSLSWDPTETADDLRRWMSTQNQSWPHGVDEGGQIAAAFGVTSQSTLVVLRPDGTMERRFGYPGASESDLRAAIAAAGQTGGDATA